MLGLEYLTQSRKEKVLRVATARQHSLALILENIHDPHNVSAIFRTCDAAGIPIVNLLYTYEKFPRIGKKSSASAGKWIDRKKHTSVEECFSDLRSQGFTIYTTALERESVSLFDVDFTRKCAVLVGNEHRGASDDAIRLADASLYIPMFGMIQSLNVSVATAVTLYEAVRQRRAAGMYDTSELSEQDLGLFIKKQFLKSE